MTDLRFMSVCSGLEGASLALEPLGWTAAAFAEIEAFPSAIIAARYGSNLPGEPLSGNAPPNFGDFTKMDLSKLGEVDLLIGGSPCQAFSIAGKRLSLDDARGNLTLAYVVLAHELARSHGLRNAIWENVPGVLNTPDNAFGCFLGALVGSECAIPGPKGRGWPNFGMVGGPRARAAWIVRDAQFFGLAQRRERVFVVADFGNGADPAAVLFEPQGVRGNSPPSREAGQGVAGSLEASLGRRGGQPNDHDPFGGLIAAPLLSGGHTNNPLDETLVAHALRGEGFDASEDGTGRGTPLVPVAFTSKDYGGDATSDLSPTLRAMGHGETWANGGGQVAVAFQDRFRGDDGRGYDRPPPTHIERTGALETVKPWAVAFDTTQITSPANFSNPKPGDPVHALAAAAHVPAVAFDLRGREGGARFEVPHDTANIRAASGGSSRSYVAERWAVRRLTPTECERLQGVPDGWTKIAWRGKPPELCPDGPRYKALGNSWAVPCVAWIARRLTEALRSA